MELGSRRDESTFTLQIGGATVPEAGSSIALLFLSQEPCLARNVCAPFAQVKHPPTTNPHWRISSLCAAFPPMKISRLLSLLAILALSAATTQAANITWGSATNIAGDSDVSTTGTLLGAVMFSPAFTVANQTINGVTFTDVDPFSTSSSGVFSFPGINVGNSFLPATPPFSLLSVPYQNMLSTTASSAFTLTMSGLTPGATYAFQVWANYSSIAAAAATTMALAGTRSCWIKIPRMSRGDWGNL